MGDTVITGAGVAVAEGFGDGFAVVTGAGFLLLFFLVSFNATFTPNVSFFVLVFRPIW